jgi:hypothetical protein
MSINNLTDNKLYINQSITTVFKIIPLEQKTTFGGIKFLIISDLYSFRQIILKKRKIRPYYIFFLKKSQL